MQFSKKFLAYLKNFSHINKNMMFMKGPVQTTVCGGNAGITFFARLHADVEVPETFAIDDLSILLNVIELFENPELEVIADKRLIIRDAKHTVEITLTKPEFIRYARKPEVFTKPDGVTFKLEKDALREVLKVSAVLKTTHLSFMADGVSVYLLSTSFASPTASNFKLKLADCAETFNAVIERDILRIVDADYEVTVCSRGIIYLTNGEIEYIIPLNAEFSKFKDNQ